MRILIGLTYYLPYSSGITTDVEKLAKAFVRHGHEVTVLTSQHESSMKRTEMIDGVRVVRVPVAFRISKGLVMPQMLRQAWKEIKNADIVNLHLPQLDAAYISVMCKLRKIPIVSKYHCDLQLPAGFINRLSNWGSNIANRITVGNSNIVVTNTIDYAETSPFLKRHLDKVKAIPPLFEMPEVTSKQIAYVREKYKIYHTEKVIGMVGRLAAEKGAEVLAKAMPKILKEEPKARVIHIGPSKNVVGEENYAKRIHSLITDLGEKWEFLGLVPFEDLAPLYSIMDVQTHPSTNRTDSFGCVQIEGMVCGTPSVTTNLPGMCQPVLQYGMGKLFPINDSEKLADAVLDILKNPRDFESEQKLIRKRFSSDNIALEYIETFEKLIEK